MAKTPAEVAREIVFDNTTWAPCELCAEDRPGDCQVAHLDAKRACERIVSAIDAARREGAETPDRDEVRMTGPLFRVNGWEAGQLAQQMGSDLRERLAALPLGWRVKRAELRLSVWLSKPEKLDPSGPGTEGK